MTGEIETAASDGRGEGGPRRKGRPVRVLRILAPFLLPVLLVLLWAWVVRAYAVPAYILPGPDLVLASLINDWGVLGPALLVTLGIALQALAIALIGGVLIAILLASSRWIEIALAPSLVILQVTPVVAVAPLILIYTSTTRQALLICAWIVAFFPIFSNTMQGLKSTDHNLLDLFALYGARRWQTLIFLKLPSALPYFLTGLRIAGGLALIAAVVAEFAAGSAGAGSGLAFRLLESQYRLNIPRLFAALLLLSATGVAIFGATSLVSHLLLRRWHESVMRRER